MSVAAKESHHVFIECPQCHSLVTRGVQMCSQCGTLITTGEQQELRNTLWIGIAVQLLLFVLCIGAVLFVAYRSLV